MLWTKRGEQSGGAGDWVLNEVDLIWDRSEYLLRLSETWQFNAKPFSYYKYLYLICLVYHIAGLWQCVLIKSKDIVSKKTF